MDEQSNQSGNLPQVNGNNAVANAGFDFEAHGIYTEVQNRVKLICLADVCRVFGLSKFHDLKERLLPEEQGFLLKATLGGPQKFVAVTVSGLCKLLNSANPRFKNVDAYVKLKEFRDKLAGNIGASVMGTGMYATDKAAQALSGNEVERNAQLASFALHQNSNPNSEKFNRLLPQQVMSLEYMKAINEAFSNALNQIEIKDQQISQVNHQLLETSQELEDTKQALESETKAKQETRLANQALATLAKEKEPLTSLGRVCIDSTENVSTRTVAHLIGNITEQDLYEFLESLGIMYPRNGTYDMYAPYNQKGYGSIFQRPCPNSKTKRVYYLWLWTEKGKAWLINLWYKHHPNFIQPSIFDVE